MENYDLTLRDYFAAASLSKLAEHGPAPGCSGVQASVIARRCYELADAMLAARSPGGATSWPTRCLRLDRNADLPLVSNVGMPLGGM